MTANIATDQRTGKLMVFTADTKAWWDTLGQYVREAQTWENVLQVAGLDWEVIKAPLHTQWGNPEAGISKLIKVESHVAIVRKDTKQHLGVVGSGYQPIQNRDALKWTEALLETGAVYESAGGIGGGERIWLLARIPKADFTVGLNDEHQSFLLVTTSHDGSMSMTVKQTDTRVVCQNTLTMALQDGKQAIKIKHTKSAEDRLKQAQRMVSASIQNAATLKEKFDRLVSRKVSKETFTAVMDRLFPIKADEASKASISRRDNILTEISQLFESNDGNMFPEQRGTAYALLNSVTNFVDHARATRVKTGNPQSNIESRTESSIWGSGADLKASALAVVEEVFTGDSDSDTMWNTFYNTEAPKQDE